MTGQHGIDRRPRDAGDFGLFGAGNEFRLTPNTPEDKHAAALFIAGSAPREFVAEALDMCGLRGDQ